MLQVLPVISAIPRNTIPFRPRVVKSTSGAVSLESLEMTIELSLKLEP
ncbi:MAG TPA: hypothetical protein VKA91_04475 [Nitrososphaeraceae archaeon]|nr:hypothetical protein [Nitrososphaeraceae archaeon]